MIKKCMMKDNLLLLKDLLGLSKIYPKSDSYERNKIKVVLDLSNYLTK